MSKWSLWLSLVNSYLWIIQWIIMIVAYVLFNQQLNDHLISILNINQKMNLLLIAPLLTLFINCVCFIFLFIKFRSFLKLQVNLISKSLLKLYWYLFSSILLAIIINLILSVLGCVINLKSNEEQINRLIIIIIGIIFSLIMSILNSVIFYILNLRFKYEKNIDQKQEDGQ